MSQLFIGIFKSIGILQKKQLLSNVSPPFFKIVKICIYKYYKIYSGKGVIVNSAFFRKGGFSTFVQVT